MIGELASAIPAEGGFYIWVRRALGPFWGYQESWLSLSASIFDMALYPAIFVLYLGKFSPALTAGWTATAGRWRWWRFAACGTCAARRPWARTRWGCSCCCWRRSRSSWFSASGMGSRCIPPSNGARPAAPASARLASRRRCWWPCGTTWAGTTPPLWPGGGESAAQLSPRHDRGHHPDGRHLHSAAGGDGAGRPLRR